MISDNKKITKSIELARALFDPLFDLRVQVFSFGWVKNRLIAVGQNQNKTHPLNKINKLIFRDSGKIHIEKKVCAELDLFLKLKNTTNIPYNKITVINIRIDRNGEIKNSKPCNSCKSLITYMQPRKLVYSNDFGGFEEYSN